MLVLSHRGYHVHVPENTLEAFGKAVSMRVDGVETDVRISRDGLPVLFHNRIAPNGQAVADLTREELSAVAGYPVPTLDEAVSEFPDLFWNLEIKVPQALKPTVDVVYRRIKEGGGPLLITSFHHPIVQEVVSAVDVEGGILVAHRPVSAAALLQDLDRNNRITAVVWDFEVVNADLLAEIAETGLKNFVYGAKTPREHQQLYRMRVEGVITDRPEYATAA
jgi:glycerophosphoryl diester phosphodiesterase